ncbi:MAG TPA: hypothetical protein QGF35_08135 [Dehalococcoidia bacterium]|nr:hypothetical protein [Dehalococcoidia bacterium]
MLTPYDEYPVHQTAYPINRLPSTDLLWSEGYWDQIYRESGDYVLYIWKRMFPNSDVIDASVGLMYDGGRHYYVHLSRQLRPNWDLNVGPLKHTFVEPFREVNFALGDNDSDVSFDLTFLATAPPFEEAHHRAERWGRVINDQTRITQIGTGRGWIDFRGERIEVDTDSWTACRDHSWGIYAQNRWSPLGPSVREFMPPPEPQEHRFAMRFWALVNFGDHSAFYGWHESSEGKVVEMNEMFGTPFEGRVDYGFGEKRDPIKLVDVKHDLQYEPNTRILKSGRLQLTDEHGQQREHEFHRIAAPQRPDISNWTDGQGQGVYRGPLAFETFEADLRKQPTELTLPDGTVWANATGAENVCEFIERSDEGESRGVGNIEFVLVGPYAPYGWE